LRERERNMKRRFRRSARGVRTRTLKILCLVAVAGILTVAATPGEAKAEQYDPQKAANPIRIAAYILHPVGVLLDYGLVRPCYWVVRHEPFSTIFGYEEPWREDLPERD
jgi:hypothetical protein